MARLDPVDLDRLGFFSRQFVRFVYWVSERMLGKVVLPLKIAAHHPRLLFGRSLVEGVALGSHSVDDRLKTLASLSVSLAVGCPH
jgi:hypothetical protein